MHEITEAEIVTDTGAAAATERPGAPHTEPGPKREIGELTSATKEDYHEALRKAADELCTCTGPLVILHGYLDDHDPLDDGSALPDVLIAARDMIFGVSEHIQKASKAIAHLI